MRDCERTARGPHDRHPRRPVPGRRSAGPARLAWRIRERRVRAMFAAGDVRSDRTRVQHGRAAPYPGVSARGRVCGAHAGGGAHPWPRGVLRRGPEAPARGRGSTDAQRVPGSRGRADADLRQRIEGPRDRLLPQRVRTAQRRGRGGARSFHPAVVRKDPNASRGDRTYGAVSSRRCRGRTRVLRQCIARRDRRGRSGPGTRTERGGTPAGLGMAVGGERDRGSRRSGA